MQHPDPCPDPQVEVVDLNAGGHLYLVTLLDGYRLEYTKAGVTFSVPLTHQDVMGVRAITGSAACNVTPLTGLAA